MPVSHVVRQVGWSPLHYATLGGHVAAVEALLRAGAYPCFRDNHMISPLHLASTQAGEKETFRRIAELLGPSALLARDEVRDHPAMALAHDNPVHTEPSGLSPHQHDGWTHAHAPPRSSPQLCLYQPSVLYFVFGGGRVTSLYRWGRV